MSNITFGNFTVISSSEGGWQEPELGFIDPGYEYAKLINTDGELAKPVASGGCDHSITINFVNVALASVAGIQARIASLKTKGVQTLTIPEFPAIPNCVFKSAKRANKRTSTIAIAGTVTLTAKKNVDYTLTFRQLFD
jgi:hypothetical protein